MLLKESVTTTRRTGRRVCRPPIKTSRKTEVKPQPKTASGDFVYAVKSELRSSETGHPLLEPPTFAVDEVYRTMEMATAKMQAIVHSAIAFELARARTDPHSPAWSNIVCGMNSQTTSWEVVRADGMILSYFVDKIPIL